MLSTTCRLQKAILQLFPVRFDICGHVRVISILRNSVLMLSAILDLLGSRGTTHEGQFMVASLCKNAMIIGLVVFKLQISDFFVYHA